MEWRSGKSEKNEYSGIKPQKIYKQKFNNTKSDYRFQKNDADNETKKDNFKNKRVNDNYNQSNSDKSHYKKKNNFKNQTSPKLYFKTHEEVDDFLSSGKYIPANKRAHLESLRDKLKEEYNKKHPDINNESMFPSLSITNIQVEQSKTCWGKKLPLQIYDTTVPFEKHKHKPKISENKVNSEISEDNQYDSFDDDEDYYNDYDDDYDDDYDEGY